MAYLFGWQEIATYLKAGCSKDKLYRLGLPVKRSHGTVIATTEELDSWLETTKQKCVVCGEEKTVFEGEKRHGFRCYECLGRNKKNPIITVCMKCGKGMVARHKREKLCPDCKREIGVALWDVNRIAQAKRRFMIQTLMRHIKEGILAENARYLLKKYFGITRI